MPRPGTPVFPPGALALSQQVSEAGMNGECTIAAPDATGALNTGSGEHATVAGTVRHTDRPCRIFPVPLNERQVTVADEPLILSRYYLRLPLGTTILENDRVTITAVDGGLDDDNLVGRTFRVLDHTPRVFATDLRVTVQAEPVP